MKLCSLSSGSKGNSIFIESRNAKILIDAGLSSLQIRKRLDTIHITPQEIDAIILTHAHRDHVHGANVLSQQFNIPVYGHPDTLDDLTYFFRNKKNIVPWTGPFIIKDLHLKPFRLSHDAFPTVGYQIKSDQKSIAVCTDLGIITNEVEENLTNIDVLLIESNHDPDMLINGPYSWELKERIASRVGHLSNHDTGILLKKIINRRMYKIILGHLSEENNTPELAKNTILEYVGIQFEDIVEVVEQRKVSQIFDF